nr:MAG TPA: hypothetical protein [Caudoviricetes sp.]DAX56817.1 MAG TPA: hypothetical protein [Caudoviricetes sp.]
MTTARKKMPADRKAPKVPFKKLPGAKYFRPLNEIDPVDALEAVEALQGLDGDDFTNQDMKLLVKAVVNDTFIVDVETFRKEFYNAANLLPAIQTVSAFVEELGKGMRSTSSSQSTKS